MKNFPKRNEEIIERAVNSLRDFAPDTKFKGKGLADIAPQADRSFASHQRLRELYHQITQELIVRDTEDVKVLEIIEVIVEGVIGHEDFGKDSALYEALGFVRKSQRKSGLTRKKNKEVTPMP